MTQSKSDTSVEYQNEEEPEGETRPYESTTKQCSVLQ